MLFYNISAQDLPINKIVEEKKILINYSKHNFISAKSNFLAGIIKIPPKEERTLSYTELPRTEEDEKKIIDLISTLGMHNKFILLLNHEKRLRKIGTEIRYLHPLKFLGFIFSNKTLKNHMAVIFDDYFKRTNFVKDFAQTMDIYDLKNKLTIYIEDFANEVNISADKIYPFINNKEWESLVKFLINY